MRTNEYPYYQCDFPEFNKAQQDVVPFLDKDANLIIALGTGVGKTALAECVFGYHLNTHATSKVVYISPFKSISGEKHKKWLENPQLSPFGVLLCNGDNAPETEEWAKKRIYLLTCESFDSKTRNTQNTWVKDIACAVFDEAHIIGQQERGGRLESCLMRLTVSNPGARIIFLSGTMGNAIELAKWVKSLNGKETKCIESQWKPVKTVIKFHAYDDTAGFKTSIQERLDNIYDIIDNAPTEKIIVFVHSKFTGKSIIDFLKKKGIKCAFHNAGLTQKVRQQIEDAFNDDNSGLNVIVSTSTLSAGVNL